jgi:two-component system, cell cycle sensor histidine kinase and response regulator CckA
MMTTASPPLICAFIHDITDRKLTEKNIIEAKEQWEETFNAIDDSVTIHNRDMQIMRANKAAGDLFQMAPTELIGRYCYELFRNAAQPCADCPEILAGRDLTNHRANIYHQKLGKTFETASNPIIDNTGLSGFVHVAKDITRQSWMEEQLKQAQKMEAIGTLAGGIAHDFNNILTPYPWLFRNSNDRGCTGQPPVQQSPANQYSSFTGQRSCPANPYLQPSGNSGEKTLKSHLVVKEALKLLRASLPTTIEFRSNIATDCGTIMIDPTQFHQIIMNLCTNVYHAMETSGGVLAVSLRHINIDEENTKVADSELLPGDYVLLEVSNTGCGMEHKTMARIFEPYFTTKSNGKGAGLGLSMVHGIVKSCQGKVSVYSEPGKGSNFHIYLPRVPDPEPALNETVPTSSLPTGSEHLLVVDDEAIITSMLQAILTNLDYQVTISNNSLEALTLIEQNPNLFDLLITDMTIPHLTGLELAQKTLTICPELPVILCTGFSELINKEQAYAIGIRAYLMEPVSVRELAISVHQILSGNENLA